MSSEILNCTCQFCNIKFNETEDRIAYGRGKFCSKLCYSAYQRWTPEIFWNLVDRSGDCWIWNGPPDKDGYGRVKIYGVKIRTNRLSYLLGVGDIPDGLIICHSCDNPPCVNPDHLFAATHKQNTQDMLKKGRQKGGPNSQKYRHIK